MPLYPLGISRRRDVPSVPKQAAGSVDVRWSLTGELACAFIDAPHQAVPPMLHATVLDAIYRRICVLPVRFGLALHDETEIHSLLQERRHDLLDHLSRLDRTCEMGVQIAPSTPIPIDPCTANEPRPPNGRPENGPNAMTGRVILQANINNLQSPIPRVQSPLAYLEQRRSYYQSADEDVEQDRSTVQQFVERLHGCYRQWRKLPSSPSHRIRLAFLVERDRVMAFRSRVENARKACQEGRCVVLGPWPPYSFVEALSERFHMNVGSL